MLSVGDSVADDILQEHLHTHQLHMRKTLPQQKNVYLQDTSGLFIDKTTYPLDSSSSCQSSDSRLSDALNKTKLASSSFQCSDNYSAHLNVVPQDLAMPLGAALSETLASFAAASHSSQQEEFL